MQRACGGEVVSLHRFATEVRGTSLGDLRVEIDSKPLKDQRYKAFLDRVGAGSAIVAREPTGVVQAVEQPDHPFRVGVQWHPEYIPQHRQQRGLFEGLVAAARAT